jgi:hypothetical protein
LLKLFKRMLNKDDKENLYIEVLDKEKDDFEL